MTDILEGATATQGIGAALDAGLGTLSKDAQITFVKYVRQVLPVDGYVFWIATAISASKKGSLHFSVSRQQSEDETIGVNQVVFSSEQKITDLNFVNPNELYIATLSDGVQYAFSSQGRYYQPANVYHYSGVAVYPALRPQVINDATGFLPLIEATAIVSNSLPLWISLNTYVPPYPGFNFVGALTLYPSYLVPNNLAPPYGAVHIEASQTDSIQSAPYYDSANSPWQLSEDTVKVTIYGQNNYNVLNVRDTILQYSFDTNYFGIMDFSAVRDDKRTQAEISAIAMKKTITFRVSYNQTTVRNVTRQLIEKVVNNYFPQIPTATGFVPIAP